MLDNRLNAILSHINCNTFADIGCDHGKVLASAILLGKAKLAIGVDISPNSLFKSKILAEKVGISEKCKFYLGDGVLPITEPVDTVLIAGMGANEIVSILKQGFIASKYILVPHQDTKFLREFINGDYQVDADYTVVAGGKFYDIIIIEKGNTIYALEQLYYGLNLPSSDSYLAKLELRKKTIEKIKSKNDKISCELQTEWEILNNEL